MVLKLEFEIHVHVHVSGWSLSCTMYAVSKVYKYTCMCCTYFVIGWVETDTGICMLVRLVEGASLKKKMGTVAMDGSSLLGELALLADVQSFEVPLESSFVVLAHFVLVLCLSIQFLHSLLLCVCVCVCVIQMFQYTCTYNVYVYVC